MGAIINILFLISLLFSMFNLLGILAADRIIDYFKLDARLPWAARYFSLRKTVQKYSFIWNFVLVLICFTVLFIFNIFVFFKDFYL